MKNELDLNLIEWLNLTSEAILIANEEHVILNANEAFLEMTGYRVDEIMNQSISKIISEVHSGQSELVRLTTVEGNQLITRCFWNQIKDNCTYIVLTFRNISYEAALEKQLQLEQERIQEVKALAKIGNWELDLQTDTLYWSEEVYKMFNINPSSGHPSYESFLERVHPEDREMVNRVFTESIKNGTDYNIIHRVLLNDEVRYYKEIAKTLYKDYKPVKSIGLIQDVTERTIKQKRLEEKEIELKKTQNAILTVLMEMEELKDNETGKHVIRTQIYLDLLARKLKSQNKIDLSEESLDLLCQVAPLHDIGKVGIPDHILRKPGKLNREEFEIMKQHTFIGYNVIEKVKTITEAKNSSYLNMAGNIILYHHERWNGTGYPYGLVGSTIPIEGRIMALADVYDALRSKRSYKPPFSHKKAMSIICSESGKHFDPDIIAAFMSLEKEFEEVSHRLSD